MNPKMLSLPSLLFLASCVFASEPPGQGFLPNSLVQAGCEEYVVSRGFGLGWERLNHRISRWGIWLDDADCRAQHVEVDHVGGSFSDGAITSDEPEVTYPYDVVVGGSQAAAARVSIGDVVPPAGVVEGDVRFTRDELGLTPSGDVVALLEGIGLDTDVVQADEYPVTYPPKRGFTTRGFGAYVWIASADADEVVVAYRIWFETGATHDRPFMSAAGRLARIGARVDVLVVATEEPIHERPVAGPIDAEWESLHLLQIEGISASRGFYGLSGFRFEFDYSESCADDDKCVIGGVCTAGGRCEYPIGELADYLRSAEVGVEMNGWDSSSRKAGFFVRGRASNASEAFQYYELGGRFSAGVVWIQAGKVEHSDK